MKKIMLLSLFFSIVLGISNVKAQDVQKPDSLGLPGDNLNLYAVMKIFQESKTLEAFERKLNDENSRINNLDLNGDDKVDYIRVIDNPQGNVHNIVLQVPINDKENQDVAVFIVDKNDKGEVQIQLIGDEELYGKDYIVEPNYDDNAANTQETPNPGYVKQSTQTRTDANGNTTVINNYTTRETASWPVVNYMYDPYYTTWVSPWYWSYYPTYWNPWKPWYWHYYYGYHYNWYNYYYRYYRYGRFYRNPYARNYYYGRRNFSPVFIARKQSGNFRTSYNHPEYRKNGAVLYKKEVSKTNKNNTERVQPNKTNERTPNNKTDRTEPNKTIKPSSNQRTESSTPTKTKPTTTNVPSRTRPSESRTENPRPSSSRRPH